MITVAADDIRAVTAEDIAFTRAAMARAAALLDGDDADRRGALLGTYAKLIAILDALPEMVVEESPFEDCAALRACVKEKLKSAMWLVALAEDGLKPKGSA